MNIVKLSEVCDFESGFAFSSSYFSRTEGIGLIRIRDIKSGRSTDTNYTGEYDNRYLVNTGDYLIGMDGEFRCYQWKGSPALLNQRVCRLKADTSRLDPRYFFYSINTHLKEIEDVTTFTTVKHISVKQIKNISLKLPNLEEQRRIVAKLDAAFEKIEKAIELTESSLALSSALRSSLIEKYMSEESTEPIYLDDFCKFENGDRGKNYPSKSKQIASGIPFINAGNLNRSKIDFTGMAYISQATFDSLGGGKIRRNDILFCLRGSIGKFASVGDLRTGAIASSLVIIRPDIDRALTDYLLYYFEGEQCSRMIRKFENGAAQPNLSGGSLKKFKINLPDVKRQTRIVELLNMATDKIDTVTELRKEKLQLLYLLKHSMLSRAFSESAVK